MSSRFREMKQRRKELMAQRFPNSIALLALILHYRSNNALINEGDLVLIDAGCEYDHYASDITRTFPANGKFSDEQRAIYEIVLNTQLAAIAYSVPAFRKPLRKLKRSWRKAFTDEN